MKFNKGEHLQEIDSQNHGIVISISEPGKVVVFWYQLENDELGLENHWVPESRLELHKQTLREKKLKELGI